MNLLPSDPDKVEAIFGDPWDQSNPLGHHAVLAADESRLSLTEAEQRLDEAGVNAAFVPQAEGGRFTQTDVLARTLRSLWRHDPSLGVSYGLSPFNAGVAVWGAGDARQRQRTAAFLLAGRKIANCGFAPAYHDGSRAGLRATRAADGSWRLDGREEVVTDWARAEAAVVLASSEDEHARRGASLFLVEKSELPEGAVHHTPHSESAGLRGVPLGAGTFAHCSVSARALIGEPGRALETAAASVRLNRGLLPSAWVGSTDTALSAATMSVIEHRLHECDASEPATVRAALTDVFTDLLAVDAFSTVTLRALHLVPEQASAYAAASMYLSSGLVLDAFGTLRSVLGARSGLREGRYAIFQKLARDVAATAAGRPARTACLADVLPRLSQSARLFWLRGESAAPAGLFQLGTRLPELDFSTSATHPPGADSLISVLSASAQETVGSARLLGRLSKILLEQLDGLRAACAARDAAEDASVADFAMAGDYTALLAAAAAWGVHAQNPDLIDEVVLVAILARLLRRLPVPAVLNEREKAEVRDHLWHALVRRVRERRPSDLTAGQIPG